MTSSLRPDPALALIELEKRRDRFIRRVNVIAWSVSFGVVLVVALLVGLQVSELAGSGMPRISTIGLLMPFIDVLWKLSLLIAALSTVGIFLRLRTASLTEIQLRLGALEEMLANRKE